MKRTASLALVMVAILASCGDGASTTSTTSLSTVPTATTMASTSTTTPATTSPATTTTTTVPTTTTTMSGVIVLVATYADGEVDLVSDRVEVDLDSDVEIQVTSDVAEEVHVHGYDFFGDVAAGETVTISFTADIPGIFEVELEDSRQLLFELEVS